MEEDIVIDILAEIIVFVISAYIVVWCAGYLGMTFTIWQTLAAMAMFKAFIGSILVRQSGE